METDNKIKWYTQKKKIEDNRKDPYELHMSTIIKLITREGATEKEKKT